jgi:GPH family glycoside/pentoside/hexuronide:cation symporter
MWPLVRAFGGVDGSGNLIDPERGFLLGSVIVAAVVILVSVYHYFTTKERVHPQNVVEKPFLESVKILFRNGNFCRNVVMFFFVQTIISAIVGYGLYYATYVLGNAGMLTLLNVVYLLSNMLIIPFVNKFIRKLGRNKTIIVSSIVLLLGEIVFLSMPKTLTGAITLVLAAGFATSMFNMVVTLNRADIADEVERTEGCRPDSMISNVSGFAVKCASSLVSLLFGWVLEFTHYDATLDVQPQSAVNGILFILGWFVVICCIGMILSTPRDRKEKVK